MRSMIRRLRLVELRVDALDPLTARAALDALPLPTRIERGLWPNLQEWQEAAAILDAARWAALCAEADGAPAPPRPGGYSAALTCYERLLLKADVHLTAWHALYTEHARAALATARAEGHTGAALVDAAARLASSRPAPAIPLWPRHQFCPCGYRHPLCDPDVPAWDDLDAPPWWMCPGCGAAPTPQPYLGGHRGRGIANDEM